MIRDPLHREICKRLDETSNGDLFEACMCDILHRRFPTLVPVKGGDDAGTDGVVIKPDGQNVRLICTTGEDAIGNLTRSIKSYESSGGKDRNLIFVTSKSLTARKKRNLVQKAEVLGFHLEQPIDQAGVVNFLYREPSWLKELLGIEGSPPALSSFPENHRPSIDLSLIGRDEEYNLLCDQKSDFVLAGQPGSGKTYLLSKIAEDRNGLFVVGDEITQIVNEIRHFDLELIIIDDSYTKLELIGRLRQARRDINGEFRIIASCWPGQHAEVSRQLGATDDQIYNLEGLPQEDILKIVKLAGIQGPDHLLKEIIHQANGNPGLAVTLCVLVKRVGVKNLFTGEVLLEDIRNSLQDFVGEYAIEILACFAIGGDSGLELGLVAKYLKRPAVEIRRTVEQLSLGGLIEVKRDNRLAVFPHRLRQVAVRDVFFKSGYGLDATSLIERAPNVKESYITLIAAKLLGGDVNEDFLRKKISEYTLERGFDNELLSNYARIGKAESDWVLRNFPNQVRDVAESTLHISPNETIRLLLNQEDGHQKGTIEKCLPVVEDWIKSAPYDGNESIKRRVILLEELEKWYVQTKNHQLAIAACTHILTLEFLATSVPPGQPGTFTWQHGLIPQQQLSDVALLWPRILRILKNAQASQGGLVANMLHYWIHPYVANRNCSGKYTEEARNYAKSFLRELIEAFRDTWQILYYLRPHACELGIDSSIYMDELTEKLFPGREPKRWEEAEEKRAKNASKLAAEWVKAKPKDVISRVVELEKQAVDAKIDYPRVSVDVFRKIADEASNNKEWLTELVAQDAPADLVESFLENVVKSKQKHSEDLIIELLKDDRYRLIALKSVLKHFDAESHGWEKARPIMPEFNHTIGIMVLRNEISNDNIRKLLAHESKAVRAEAATNLWSASPKGDIPENIFDDWKEAIVICVKDDHTLVDIANKYPDIIHEWLLTRISSSLSVQPLERSLSLNPYVNNLIDSQNASQRKRLIEAIPDCSIADNILKRIVNDDLEIFRCLLEHEVLGDFRLSPLSIDKEVPENWITLAKEALDRGFSEEDIFRATHPSSLGWTGSQSNYYEERTRLFEELKNNPDDRISHIGRRCVSKFTEERDRNKKIEKKAAIRGELV